MIRPRRHIAAMNPYPLATKTPPGAVALSQNESAFPPSPAALAAGGAALDQSLRYPDSDWRDLRAAISEVHGLDPETLLCGAGSMELIALLIRAYAGPEDEVLGTEYGYLYVATVAAETDARHVTVAEPDLTVSVDRLLDAVSPRTRIVFLCNPGNPTGTLIPNADILRLRAALPNDVLLVVDQAYGEFADAEAPPAEIFALAARGDTVITRTLSKAYGLAGARIGWAVAPSTVVETLRKIQAPGGVTPVSQAMAAAAMRDQDYMLHVVRETAARRDDFAARCRGLGLPVPESRTNFVLLPFATAEIAAQVDAALQAGGYIARGMGGYGLRHCLRVTIGDAAAMAEVTRILNEPLA